MFLSSTIQYYLFSKHAYKQYWNKFLRLLNIRRYDIITTELSKWDYHEEYERMLYGIMAILCEYIEEGDYDLIDWSINNYHITQSTNMLKAYIWWRYDRPDEDEPVNRWVNGEISLEECERQERWIDEKDQEMLHCVINSRLNLS